MPARRRVISSDATTRTAPVLPVPGASGPRLLPPGLVITKAETATRYRVGRLLGQGGFGQVYLARRLGRSDRIPALVCIKVSERIDGWLREAYFGQVLDGHPRAIRVYDQFPLMRTDGRPLYCLTLEYARHGDLPSAITTVVVRGKPNVLQAAGRDAGVKLMEIKRLREKGQRITLINESQFWRLAGKR